MTISILRSINTPLLAGILCASWLVHGSTAEANEICSFADVPYGLIIGAHSDGKWLTSEQAGKVLEAGTKYRLFTIEGKAGEAVGGKPEPNADVCPDVWEQKLTPEPEREIPAIAVAASWNPMPRVARASDKTQEVYVKAARDFLMSKGIAKAVVKITQLLRVDLDGDGEDEVLLSATNYPGEADSVPPSAKAGNYSFVLLRHVVKGKLRTAGLEGDFYPKATDSRTPYRHSVIGLLDLNGDGRLEVLLHSSYYEGGATSVWQFGKGRLERMLETGCGA